MTTIDIKFKQYIREFLQMKIDQDKARAGMFKTAGGFTLREVEMEGWLDEMWVFINKRSAQDHNGSLQSM